LAHSKLTKLQVLAEYVFDMLKGQKGDHLKTLIVIFILAITTQALAYEGLEECHDSSGEIHSVAYSTAGLRWIYTYNGTQYNLSGLDLLIKPANKLPVEHVAEKVTSVKCNGHDLVERTSIRKVILRDPSFNPVVEAKLQCVGSFPMPWFQQLCP